MFLIERLGKEIFSKFWRQQKIWFRVQVDDIEGRSPIEGTNSRVRLASSPQIDTGEVEVRTMSGEIILDTRKERRNSY